jgi:hypothetical protein
MGESGANPKPAAESVVRQEKRDQSGNGGDEDDQQQ